MHCLRGANQKSQLLDRYLVSHLIPSDNKNLSFTKVRFRRRKKFGKLEKP